MTKAIVLFLIGAIAGGGAVYLASPGPDDDPSASGANARADVRARPVQGAAPSGLDPETALATLSSLGPGAERRSAALEALEAVGHDEAGIARVAAALPAADRFGFEADALAAIAGRDLPAALAILDARGGSALKRLLIAEIGEAAGRNDPVAALAAAGAMSDANLRSGFTLGVLNGWVALDPAGMLEYLETADPRVIGAPNPLNPFAAQVPFDRLVLGDPEGALAGLERLPVGPLRQSVQRAALLALAETDAVATLARLDDLPPGRDRSQLVEAVAETYGRQDSAAALAWVASLSPPSQEALNGVVSGIAAVDVNRAVDWVLREIEAPTVAGLSAPQALPATELWIGLRAGTLAMPGTVERLLAAGDPTLKSRAASVIMIWSQSNAEAAVDFALGQLDRLEPADLRALAMQTAQSAPDVAARTPDRLPPDYRAPWVASVADALVRTSPDRARSFLDAQRGQPGYEEGVVAVVRQIASADAPAAAALLAEAGSSPELEGAAQTVANAWARQDPQAAAAWALTLGRPQPAGVVAAVWARDDRGAAEGWALNLPAGEVRDAGITGVLLAAASEGELSASLLDALSTDAERQQSATRAILTIGRSNQARARELVAVYVTDPELRRQTEDQLAQLARAAAAGSNVPRLPGFVQ